MFYNCHIHTFTEEDIPEMFIPFALVKLLKTKIGFKIITGLLKGLIPFNSEDEIERYAHFIEIGRMGSQEKIFLDCAKYYPKNTGFIILAMDMAFMGAGKVPRPYHLQLQELAEMKNKYPNVTPFIHVDPRRKNYLELLKTSVEDWGFRGVKLYPPLGYFPYDEDMFPVYEYCEEKNIPVLAHCSPFNPVYFKGSNKELHKLLSKSKDSIVHTGKKRRELTMHFTHPENYLHVIEKFKKLRICLAHYGSEYYWDKFLHKPNEPDNWLTIINRILQEYENFYADISFTLNNIKFFPLLKVLLSDPKISSKVLFGSDYYMVQTRTDERRFGLELRAILGEEMFKTIAEDNPKKFLGLNS
jgi:uncharacterized protein